MRRLSTNNHNARWITVQEAREVLSLSRGSVMKVAEEKNAIRRVGRAVRIDIDAITNEGR